MTAPPKKILGLFRKADAPIGWLPVDGTYPCVTSALKGVAAKPGIYVLWHRGVRPQWLRVGGVANLAAAFVTMAEAPEIAGIGVDVFAAWAMPVPTQHSGILCFLAETLKPALQHAPAPWDAKADPGAVPIVFPLPPGTTL